MHLEVSEILVNESIENIRLLKLAEICSLGMREEKNMKKVCICFVIMMLLGCTTITYKKKQQEYFALETDSGIYQETEDMDIPEAEDFDFPVPSDLGKIIRYSKNNLNTIIKNEQIMSEYYTGLEKNNWKLLRAKNLNSPVSMYFNGLDGLLIKDGILNDKVEREVVINYYKGKEHISDTNEYDDKIKQFLIEDEVYAISEYDITEATKEMGLRGFYAYTNKMEPVKIVVDQYDGISLINYDQFLVCDIDADGEKEFITRLGYGSGRYIITLSVWKYNHDARKLELAYRTQYEALDATDMFIKKVENNVKIIAGHWLKGEIVENESYGNLLIKDGMLLPEKTDIPFKRLINTET